jgi:hypothetical protein
VAAPDEDEFEIDVLGAAKVLQGPADDEFETNLASSKALSSASELVTPQPLLVTTWPSLITQLSVIFITIIIHRHPQSFFCENKLLLIRP